MPNVPDIYTLNMNKKTLVFKTNLKCPNCVAKVKPALDETKEIVSWSIDLKNPDRILTIDVEEMADASLVEKILSEAGYKATLCPE